MWRYTPDYAATGAYLMSDPSLRDELHRRAELGLTVARALAPVLRAPRRDRVEGALAASGQVTDDGLGGAHHDRMQVSISFDVEQGYAAAATWPHHGAARSPAAADYLRAAIPIIERG